MAVTGGSIPGSVLAGTFAAVAMHAGSWAELILITGGAAFGLACGAAARLGVRGSLGADLAVERKLTWMTAGALFVVTMLAVSFSRADPWMAMGMGTAISFRGPDAIQWVWERLFGDSYSSAAAIRERNMPSRFRRELTAEEKRRMQKAKSLAQEHGLSEEGAAIGWSLGEVMRPGKAPKDFEDLLRKLEEKENGSDSEGS